MKELETFMLCEEKTERIWVLVSAEIKGGCLTISGHDMGGPVEMRFVEDEHEYWYRFDEMNTEHLIELLARKEPDIKKALLDEFGGEEGCSNMRKFCKANGIKYKFDSWF